MNWVVHWTVGIAIFFRDFRMECKVYWLACRASAHTTAIFDLTLESYLKIPPPGLHNYETPIYGKKSKLVLLGIH